MKNYGISRVMEPHGALPVTAWKLDNSRFIGKKEIRIQIDFLNLEFANFQQLVSSCDYDEAKIKAKIMQIVSERGKLHNPYTKSGGLISGKITEIGSEFHNSGFKVGDKVICLSSLTGLPMYIESIGDIDFQYGQAECSGYVICFETTHLVKWDGSVNLKHLMRLLDEEGNLLGVKSVLEPKMVQNVAIISSNLQQMMFYAKMVRQTVGDEAILNAILDSHVIKDITKKDFNNIFGDILDSVHFADLNLPSYSVDKITNGKPENYADVVINIDGTEGSESMASLLVKDKGTICYMSFQNGYSEGSLIADSLGKEIHSYSTYGHDKGVYLYSAHLIKELEPNLEKLDKYYNRQKRSRKKNIHDIYQASPAMQRIDDFIYSSTATADMVEKVLNIAKYDCNVVIQGETGSGKEKVFNLIHQNSQRQGKPCVKINCATIPENLAESEFFGYEKGAFTGAQKDGKEGYFEMANNGTLFLDEIGTLSMSMQSKLLRVLQENTFYRLGGTQQITTNVRVVCANNVPLRQLIDEGKFREDLYYRLNICLIDVPPLRERVEDIQCLSDAFMKAYSKRYGVEKSISPEAQKRLNEYHWPGNVRELENIVHRLYIAQLGEVIESDDVDEILGEGMYNKIMINMKKELQRDAGVDFTLLMEEQERKIIQYALEKEGTTRKAADFLNIPQTTFVRKKNKYRI